MLCVRAALVCVFLLAAASAPLSAEWIDFGSTLPHAPPDVVLRSSDQAGASMVIDIPGIESEEVATERGRFARLAIPGSGHTTEIGAPMLPVIREHVEIPQGSTPTLRILRAEYVELPLADLGLARRLYPVQPPVPKVLGALEAAEFELDAAAYRKDKFTPDVPATLGHIGQIRAHRFVELEVFPVQYNPATGVIRYATRIEVAIDFHDGDLAGTREILDRYASPDFDLFARRNFINAAAFAGRPVLPLPIGCLIITYDDYYEEIETLAGLRHRLGYETTVTKLSEVPGGATTTAIQSYIQDAYDTWAVPPAFVLLVGDTPQIPAFTGTESYSATDLYYTTMDGASDWLPDIYIGRFSCDSEADVSNLAGKTVDYIRFALTSGTDWIKKATFMASSDNYTISEGTHNHVISTWLDPAGFTSHKRYYHSGATTGQVVGDINAGISQLTYSGHGATNSWADGPPMDAGDVNGLTNVDMLPFIQSYACYTGQFDSACFGETWTLAPNGGVAFWGSSTTSYWDEDDVLEKGVYEARFGDGYTWIRGMLNEGMWAVYEAYSGGGYTHRYYEQYNLFGDPALDVWTGPPADMVASYASSLPIGATSFPIDVTTAGRAAVDSALVCIYMDGQVYESGYTDAVGHLDLVVDPSPAVVGTMEVWVSKHNFLPHTGTVDLIVPVTHDIDPATIPINETTGVTVTVWDELAAPKPDVVVTIDGWGIEALVDTTDALGEAHFTVTPPYGEDLTVVGRELGETYDCLDDVLPVTGGMSFAGADVGASVDSIGLYGSLAPHYEGEIVGTSSETGFDLIALGCGVANSASAGPDTSATLVVTPTSTGTIAAVIVKSGFDVYAEDIAVQVLYGTMAGEVYESARAPIEGAVIKGYPAGTDTTGETPLFETTSGVGGAYTVAGDLEVGYYDVYVSKFSYLTESSEVFIQYGANDVDFYLDAAPSGVVSGTVTETGTGVPLSADIKVYRADTMELFAETTSDSADGGYYEVTLPYYSYVMNVRATQHMPVNRSVVADEAAETEDFVLEPTLANILVIDDGAAKAPDVKLDKTGAPIASPAGGLVGSKSAGQIATDLAALGYDVTEEDAATTNASTWPDYDFIVWSSGDNLSPVADAAYRTALEGYVGAGHKLLIEGGETGYRAAWYPGYPTFAAGVLHITSWIVDESGDLTVEDGGHAVASFPNVLGTMALTYVGYGDQDANTPAPEAHVVCDWSTYGGMPGVLVYDDDRDPASGQIVYYSFNYLAFAASGRVDLLENTVAYLTALASAPTGSISGVAMMVGETDHSGIKVTAYPGGDYDYTDVDGSYAITALYGGTYTVEATETGWAAAPQEGTVVVDGEETGSVDFLLSPLTEYEHCSSPLLAIPDDDPVGVSDVISFAEDVTMVDVEVYVDIAHTYIGDLIVEVESPEGTIVRLHNLTGGSSDDILGWYDSELPVDGPGSLSDFDGESCAGDWTISVSDRDADVAGTLDSWCVRVDGGGHTDVDDGGHETPSRYVLRGVSPNPFNPTTTVTYGLPERARVRLAIYNLAGRLVRVLVDEEMSEGYHAVPWDGRDGHGASVASGIYFCRMESEGFSDAVKMVLLK